MRLTERLTRRGETETPPLVANFQGSPARGRPEAVVKASAERMEGRWSKVSRYDRRARVSDVEALTPTRTVRLGFEVTDGRPFAFEPGNFVGIEWHMEGLGYRRSPYCIISPPTDDGRFELLVRMVPDGPLSQCLGSLRPGDEVAFRGPTGRSMVPKDLERDLVLVATGVGVGPFYSLASHLLAGGFNRRIELFWGSASPRTSVSPTVWTPWRLTTPTSVTGSRCPRPRRTGRGFRDGSRSRCHHCSPTSGGSTSSCAATVP